MVNSFLPDALVMDTSVLLSAEFEKEHRRNEDRVDSNYDLLHLEC